MIVNRRVLKSIKEALKREAAVVLVGPRQIGKTTLTYNLNLQKKTEHLDLEKPADLKKLEVPSDFLLEHTDKLIVLDEVHRLPSLFPELRGIIDEGRRQGIGTGRFMLLGSASFDILTKSGESLAGRVEIVELKPLDILEVSANSTERVEDLQKNIMDKGRISQKFSCKFRP